MELRKRVVNTLKILSKHPLVKSKKVGVPIIEQWIKDTYRIDPKQLEFHALRTLSIGGSDIFKAVVFFNSVKSSAQSVPHETPFLLTSVQDMVKTKIFASSPDPQNSHTRRGALNEPLARQVFLSKLIERGRTVKARPDLVDALTTSNLRKKHRWYAYNADDIFEIDGVLTLIDYKCPAPDEQFKLSSVVEDDYLHQLHLGASGLAEMGLECELLLVKYNVIEADTIAIPVKLDPLIMQLNMRAGDYLYENYILQGKIPEYQPSLLKPYSIEELKDAIDKKIVMPDAADFFVDQIRKLSMQFAAAKSLENMAKEAANGFAEQITKNIDDVFVDLSNEQLIAIGPVEVKKKTKTEINDPKLIDLAIMQGMDLSKYQHSYIDTERLFNDIKALLPESMLEGVVTESEQTSIVMTRKRKGPSAEIKSLVSGVAMNTVLEMSESVARNSEAVKKLDDLVAMDVIKERTRIDYFENIWQNATNTYLYSQNQNNAISDFIDEVNATSVVDNKMDF